MLYVHSIQRALQYYSGLPALSMGTGRVSFRELHERVRRIAALLKSVGFGHRDRLALLLPNGPEYLELIYACAWLGVIAVPVNTRLATAEIDHVLMDASVRGIVRHSSLPAPSARVSWEVVVDLEPLGTSHASLADPCYDPDAVLALIYTSGTTGRAKGAIVTHGNILADVHNVNYWFSYREGGVYLHAAPIFHIADFPAMFAAPAFGACQVALPRFSPDAFCETVQRERVRYTVLVPTMINLLTQFADLAKYDLSSLELLAYGGSPMAPEVVTRVRERIPNAKLMQVYGLTETGFLTGLRDCDHQGGKLAACGRTPPGVELRVADEAGRFVERGQRGEFLARGANVSRGYWNHTEDTALAYRDGYFRTGDIGYQDADGYFYILDRLKDMIVTGGENVYSGEVEAAIVVHPAVREAAVFGIPDSKWGESVAATVVTRAGMQVSEADLANHCRKTLASYKVPRHWEFFTADLPKSGSGKVLKRALRERFWSGSQRAVQ